MTDPNLDIGQITSRISALERANRRWKLGGLLLLIFLVATAFLTGFRAYAQRSGSRVVPNAVIAHEFVLMGPHGNLLGRMSVVKGKPVLQFYNSAGRLWWFAPPKMEVSPVRIK